VLAQAEKFREKPAPLDLGQPKTTSATDHAFLQPGASITQLRIAPGASRDSQASDG
jgi:hypothetical protein